jgi:hypothetical protein
MSFKLQVAYARQDLKLKTENRKENGINRYN